MASAQLTIRNGQPELRGDQAGLTRDQDWHRLRFARSSMSIGGLIAVGRGRVSSAEHFPTNNASVWLVVVGKHDAPRLLYELARPDHLGL